MYLQCNQDCMGFGFESHSRRTLLHRLHGILDLMNTALHQRERWLINTHILHQDMSVTHRHIYSLCAAGERQMSRQTATYLWAPYCHIIVVLVAELKTKTRHNFKETLKQNNHYPYYNTQELSLHSCLALWAFFFLRYSLISVQTTRSYESKAWTHLA